MASERYYVGGKNATNSVVGIDASDDSIFERFELGEGRTEDVTSSPDGESVFTLTSSNPNQNDNQVTLRKFSSDGTSEWTKQSEIAYPITRGGQLIYGQTEDVLYAELPDEVYQRQLIKIDPETGDFLDTVIYDYTDDSVVDIDESGIYHYVKDWYRGDRLDTGIIKYDTSGEYQWHFDIPVTVNSVSANAEKVAFHTKNQQLVWLDAFTGDVVGTLSTEQDLLNPANDVEILDNNNVVLGTQRSGSGNGATIAMYNFSDKSKRFFFDQGDGTQYGGMSVSKDEESLYLGSRREVIKYNTAGYERKRFEPWPDSAYYNGNTNVISYPKPQIDPDNYEVVSATKVSDETRTNSAKVGDAGRFASKPNHQSYYIGGNGKRKAYVVEYDAQEHFEVRRYEVDYPGDNEDVFEYLGRPYPPFAEEIQSIDTNTDGNELYVLSSGDDTEEGHDAFIRKYGPYGTEQWVQTMDGRFGDIYYQEYRNEIFISINNSSGTNEYTVSKLSAKTGEIISSNLVGPVSKASFTDSAIYTIKTNLGTSKTICKYDFNGGKLLGNTLAIGNDTLAANENYVVVKDGRNPRIVWLNTNALTQQYDQPYNNINPEVDVRINGNSDILVGGVFNDPQRIGVELINRNNGIRGISAYPESDDIRDVMFGVRGGANLVGDKNIYSSDLQSDVQQVSTPFDKEFEDGEIWAGNYPRPQVKPDVETIRAEKSVTTTGLNSTDVLVLSKKPATQYTVYARGLDASPLVQFPATGVEVDAIPNTTNLSSTFRTNPIEADAMPNEAGARFTPRNSAIPFRTSASMGSPTVEDRENLLGAVHCNASSTSNTPSVTGTTTGAERYTVTGTSNRGRLTTLSVTSPGIDVTATQNDAVGHVTLFREAQHIRPESTPNDTTLDISLTTEHAAVITETTTGTVSIPTVTTGSVVPIESDTLIVSSLNVPYIKGRRPVPVKSEVTTARMTHFHAIEYGEATDIDVPEGD